MFEEKVLSIIAETQKIPREDLSLDTSFEEIGIDSLDGLNILFGIENEYSIDINIPNDRLSDMRDIRELINTVREYLPEEVLEKIVGKREES